MMVRLPHLKSGRCALDILQRRGVSLHGGRLDEGLQSRCGLIHIVLRQWFLRDAPPCCCSHEAGITQPVAHIIQLALILDVISGGGNIAGMHDGSNVCRQHAHRGIRPTLAVRVVI